MTDKRKPIADVFGQDKPVPLHQQPVEQIPSTVGGISALASAGAPHIYFDDAPYCGLLYGNGDITLTAGRHVALVDGSVRGDRVVTAVLHAPLAALRGLKGAIEEIEKLAGRQSVEVSSAAGRQPTSGSMN